MAEHEATRRHTDSAVPPAGRGLDLDRFKAFTDAVVAIAQTLLIIPLLESVPEARRAGEGAGEWLSANGDSLVWFAMSFVIIAGFWIGHARLIGSLARSSPVVVVLSFVWMFGIVFMPVATALLGLQPPDTTQRILYVGTMLVCGVSQTLLAIHANARRLGATPSGRLRSQSIGGGIAMTLLYAFALVASMTLPGDYLWLFLLSAIPMLIRALNGPVERIFHTDPPTG